MLGISKKTGSCESNGRSLASTTYCTFCFINNDKSSVSDNFIINEHCVTNPQEISNGFCNYCTDIGMNLANKIPNSTKHLSKYMKIKPNSKSLFWTPTSADEIIQTLKTLRGKKSTGHDGINTHLLNTLEMCAVGGLVRRGVQSYVWRVTTVPVCLLQAR